MPCFAKRGVLQKSGEAQTQVLSRKHHSRKSRKALKQRGGEAGDGDGLYKERHYVRDKKAKQKTLKRAVGAEALENCHLGPEVVIDYLECTPLPLWNCTDPTVDYVTVNAKVSTDIIPVSPKPGSRPGQADDQEDEDEEDSALRKTILLEEALERSRPMTWDPNLTELEEDEFAAEAALLHEHFKLAYCLPRENETDLYEKAVQTVQILRPDGSLELKDRVKVILRETKTDFLIHIGGHVMLEEGEGAKEMHEKNDRYIKVCQEHVESDIYGERATQTYVDSERDKYTQLVGVGVLDKSQLINDFIMFDDMNELKEMERLRKAKEEEDAIIKSLSEGTQESISETAYQDSSEEEDSDEEDKQQIQSQVEWNKIDEYFDLDEEIFPPEDINDLDEELEIPSDEELDVKVQIDELYTRRREKALKSRPKLLPDISYSVMILERIASTNKYQKKHMEIRGFTPLFKRELTRRQIYQLRNDALVESGPTLKRFWAYKPNLTKGMEVTSISVHPTNGNLIAASYGSNNYPLVNSRGGFVCVWSLKNINSPERIYHFDAAATIVVFSNLTPYLLAIGLIDGNIFVYDIRSNKPRIFCSTEKMLDKPIGPIWDLYWLQETEMASTGTVNEVLVSVSNDGYLYRWTSAKGFEPWVLLKVRRSPLKIPGRRERRAEALISQWSATYTVCFYPDDLTTYLIGTEEGFIHKCTTSYVEQFVTTYVSHTGPVYSIRFNPFAKDIFISCGGDWCVKIWKEDFPSAPLLSLCTGLRTVFDVTWAPSMSSVFVSVNELHMEIWDVTVNTLEPIIQFKLPHLGLRRVSFYRYVQGLLIGDNDGGITVYALRNFPAQPETLDEKIDHLLEGLIPGYTRQMSEEVGKIEESEEQPEEDEEEEEEDEGEEDEEDDDVREDDQFIEDLEGILENMMSTDILKPKS